MEGPDVKTGMFTGTVAAVLAISLPTQAQTIGGQGANQATPMQEKPSGTPAGVNAAPVPERKFVAAAATANRYEIQTAELALTRAGDAKLKEFARMMLTDHKRALEQLAAAAKEADVAMPTGSALDQPHASKLASLESRKNPGEFDQAYRTDQVQAHQQALTLLETYQRIGAKEPLRVWAAKTLPAVRKHLEMLNAMK